MRLLSRARDPRVLGAAALSAAVFLGGLPAAGVAQAAMPAATFPIVMARLYEQDVQTAWVVVVGTSLLSLITIPLWMILGAAWLF